MTKKASTFAAIVAVIGLATWTVPALAQEPDGDVSSPTACTEHDASMDHEAMEMGHSEMGDQMDMDPTAPLHGQMHDQRHNGMAMMHATGGAHAMDDDSMPLSPSSMGSRHMSPGTMMSSGR